MRRKTYRGIKRAAMTTMLAASMVAGNVAPAMTALAEESKQTIAQDAEKNVADGTEKEAAGELEEKKEEITASDDSDAKEAAKTDIAEAVGTSLKEVAKADAETETAAAAEKRDAEAQTDGAAENNETEVTAENTENTGKQQETKAENPESEKPASEKASDEGNEEKPAEEPETPQETEASNEGSFGTKQVAEKENLPEETSAADETSAAAEAAESEKAENAGGSSSGKAAVTAGNTQAAAETAAAETTAAVQETTAVPQETTAAAVNPAGENAEEGTFALEASKLTAFAAGAMKDGDSKIAGDDDFFTILYSAKSKVDSSSKTFDDDYSSGQRINFGGKATTEMNALKFKTGGPAKVKIWWVEGGDNNRQMVILDKKGKEAAKTEVTLAKNALCISTLTLEEEGTYYLGGDTGSNYIFKVEVTTGDIEEELTDWSEVSAPEVADIALDASDKGKIDVTVNAVIGNEGGDQLTVTMYDADGEAVDTAKASKEGDTQSVSFTPEKSGDYHFRAVLSRKGEEDKESEKSEDFAFVLPLAAPQIKNITNQGSGSVTVKFFSSAEAEQYQLTVKNTVDDSVRKVSFKPDAVADNDEEEYFYDFKGLSVGAEYELSIVAERGEDVSEESKETFTVTDAAEQEWTYANFGSNATTDRSKSGYSLNEDGTISVWNVGNSGKLVPASTDGLSFYYAAIPADQNFILRATAQIDYWTFTNGQEGFGLMAADRVGKDGNGGAFWNNSYMASGTKVQYNYDAESDAVTDDATKPLVVMKLGLGSQEKIGVTKDNLAGMEAKDSDAVAQFKSTMTTLETSRGLDGAGTYNLFGNSVAKAGSSEAQEVTGTQEDPITTVTLQIRKNNTGYFVSYFDADGTELATKKYYDTEALSHLDEDYVYAGIYASRSFHVTFSDVDLQIIDPAEDDPAEEKPVTEVTPNYQVTSADHTNTSLYDLEFIANADGVLSVQKEDGTASLSDIAVSANEKKTLRTRLAKGTTDFALVFTPAEDFHPEGKEDQVLSSYESVTLHHSVSYETKFTGMEEIYVSQNGSQSGKGTKESPTDIYTAVKYVEPGQTITLAEGRYELTEQVLIPRGMDGTRENPIRMVVDNDGRAIFDFGAKSAGFIFVGNYWYVKGIDATNSKEGTKGVQLSGSHCTFEDIRTYNNHNTGFQVSRYASTDTKAQWPSYNLIKNCTSFANADKGYEDADGFAAKLTCGEGIVFDGCISFNNADDGWDLFAKVETGKIGAVTIQNSLAFKNGYGLDGTDEGNGNGFKMGGESITGHHKIRNSVAWMNKAKGIDANSCPDIEIYHSTSFANEKYNVALYTNDAKNTGFVVDGVVSLRTENGTDDQIKMAGNQVETDIYGPKNFLRVSGETANTAAEKTVLTAADFESVEAPLASASDPLAVADSLRTADGSIDLGSFLRLSTVGLSKLSALGYEEEEVAAVLDGDYDMLNDAEEIEGAAEDSEKRAQENSGDGFWDVSKDTKEDDNTTDEQKDTDTQDDEKQDTDTKDDSKKDSDTGKTDTKDDNKNGGSSRPNRYVSDNDDDDDDDDSSSGSSARGQVLGAEREYISRDEKKGVVSSVNGIVTGEGDGYAAWAQDEKGWKLQFADKTAAVGTMVKDESGVEHEQVGWEKVNGRWYAFGADGYIKTGWVQDYSTGLWYYLCSFTDAQTPGRILGAMFAGETTPDGFTVDATGAWNGQAAKK